LKAPRFAARTVFAVSTQEDRSQERRFFRAHVRFPVTIIVPGAELVLDAESLDLSRGGMRVATATDLPAGQPIMLRFMLPGQLSELLVRGRIVLSFYDASTKTFAHGVAFTQYTTHDHDLISSFISSAETTTPK
jgi:c-di-GMP-binding flagellar brake protein YcgR